MFNCLSLSFFVNDVAPIDSLSVFHIYYALVVYVYTPYVSHQLESLIFYEVNIAHVDNECMGAPCHEFDGSAF